MRIERIDGFTKGASLRDDGFMHYAFPRMIAIWEISPFQSYYGVPCIGMIYLI